MYKLNVVRNGPVDEIVLYEVDLSKPDCWVEGCEYKFNSKIITRANVKAGLSEYELENEILKFAQLNRNFHPIITAIQGKLFNDC